MNIDDLTNLARHLHRDLDFNGIFTFAENSIIATAMIASALQLPSISVDAAVKSRNKIAMREAHRAGQAPHPEFRLTPTFIEAEAAAEQFGYPVILKPPLGSASQFVYKINNKKELEDVLQPH